VLKIVQKIYPKFLWRSEPPTRRYKFNTNGTKGNLFSRNIVVYNLTYHSRCKSKSRGIVACLYSMDNALPETLEHEEPIP